MDSSSSHRGAFSVADGIGRIFLIAVVFLLPFFVIPLPYAAIAQGKVLLAAVLFIFAALIWAYARLVEGSVAVPRSPLVYVSVLLPVAYLISTLMTGWNNASVVGTGVEQDTLTAVALMSSLFLLSAFAFYGSAAAIRLMIQGLVLGLVALFALEALYLYIPQWFSLGGTFAGQTANAFGSWHDLGIVAGLSLFLSVTI